MAAREDISYLDFELPEELMQQEVKDVVRPKSAAFVTSINDLGILAAFCVVHDIEAVVMPSGVFGTIAFLRNVEDGFPEEAAKNLTKSVQGLDIVLAQFVFGKMQTNLWRNGEIVQELVPTLVLSNLTDVAEDALIGELDVFELIATGKAQVDAKHALVSLPSNFIPKKYQAKPKDAPKDQQSNFQAFYTGNMTKEVALETLKKFQNR